MEIGELKMAKVEKKVKNTFSLNIKDKETEFMVRSPKSSELREADIIRAQYYNDGLKKGLMLAMKAREYAKQQNLWDDEKQKELNDAEKQLRDYEYEIKTKRSLPLGGPGKLEGTMFGIALKIMVLRTKIINLRTIFADMESNTVEGHAENARKNYLLYVTTVYSDTGERVFESFDDFLNSLNLTEDNVDKYTIAWASYTCYQNALLNAYNINVKDYPENQFLSRFKFIDDKGRLLNKQGEFVNEFGAKVDDNGLLINDQGNLIDINKRELTKDGEFDEEPKPFKDENGDNIIDDQYKKELESYLKSKEKKEEELVT